MKLEILNTSVVVLAEGHNPTILHPAFLTSQGIVPTTWELAEPPICTPPFSIVKYANNLVFTVESQKFQLTDSSPPEHLEDSQSPGLAAKYIQTLPHVRYTAVGVNISGFVEHSNPEAMVIERFLKSGAWNDDVNKPRLLGLRLVYSLKQTDLRFSIDSGKIKRPQDRQERGGILVNANYHKDLSQENALGEAVEAISAFQKHCRHFSGIANVIIGPEG